MRIDAEYFLKQNLLYEDLLNRHSCFVLGDISIVTDGIHDSIDYDETSEINLISATSPKDNYFDLTRNVHISSEQHYKNPRTALRENDIILSTVGTIGNCAIVNKEILPANSDRHVGIIRIKEELTPSVVSTFLLSKYGRNQTIRESTGNVQLNLFLYKIRAIKIPKFSSEFQNIIEDDYNFAQNLLINSKSYYIQAEDILNKELNITNVENSKNYSIKSLSESFVKSKRLDAEYYQDKYDSFEKAIRNYHNGYSTLNNFFKNISDKCSKNLPEYSYVEIGDINVETGDASYNIIKTKELPENAKVMAQKGDILVSTVRPNRGAIAILQDAFLVSGAFTVLRSNGAYSSQTLQVLLRNKIYKEWLLKFNVGTSYPVIKDADILNLEIPLIPIDLQYQISQKVQESFKLRKQSKDLLNKAVKAVDIAIEKSEEDAIKWLKENTNEYFTNDKLK